MYKEAYNKMMGLEKRALMPPSKMMQTIANGAKRIRNNPLYDLDPGLLLLPFLTWGGKISDPQLAKTIKHGKKLAYTLLKYSRPGITNNGVELVSSLENRPLQKSLRQLLTNLK